MKYKKVGRKKDTKKKSLPTEARENLRQLSLRILSKSKRGKAVKT